MDLAVMTWAQSYTPPEAETASAEAGSMSAAMYEHNASSNDDDSQQSSASASAGQHEVETNSGSPSFTGRKLPCRPTSDGTTKSRPIGASRPPLRDPHLFDDAHNKEDDSDEDFSLG